MSDQEASGGAQCPVLLLGTDLGSGGGVNRVIRDLSTLLSADRDLDIEVLAARSDRAPSYPFPAGVTVQQVTPPARSQLSYLRLFWALRRSHHRVIVTFWTQDNVLASALLRGSGKKVIICEHAEFDEAPWLWRNLRRLTYKGAHALLVLNKREVAHYGRFLDNVHLTSNPVTRFEPVARDQRERLVLGIGHLIERKNFKDLILAFARAGLVKAGWRLALVGDGPQRDALAELGARECGDAFEIAKPNGSPAPWYGRATLLAVPSRQEVFSLVLAEAALAGVLPLAYAVGGPETLLEDTPELLTPPADVDGLARSLKHWAEADRAPMLRRVSDSLGRRTSDRAIGGQWRQLLLGGSRSGSDIA